MGLASFQQSRNRGNLGAVACGFALVQSPKPAAERRRGYAWAFTPPPFGGGLGGQESNKLAHQSLDPAPIDSVHHNGGPVMATGRLGEVVRRLRSTALADHTDGQLLDRYLAH